MKTVIEMAREAGFENLRHQYWDCTTEGIERFAELVRADEHSRPWVGLTDEERNKLWREVVGWGDPSHDDEDLMKAIEAKLKEKNT